MAKIMLTWELGGGAGHVAPYVELVRSLAAQGHQLIYAMRMPALADRFFRDTALECLQAPLAPALRGSDRLPRADSFARILHMSGFSSCDSLLDRLRQWRELFDQHKPELILFDFSPTAMLAARGMKIRTLAVGTGFHLPPDENPIPNLCWHLDQHDSEDQFAQSEQQALSVINQALAKLDGSSLNRLCELYRADQCVFRTFRALDHYRDRKGARYWGVLDPPPGEKPAWPAGEAARVFAYLKPFRSLPTLFNYLVFKKIPTLVYGDGLPPQAREMFQSEQLQFVDRPIDMEHVARNAALSINNAGHGTIASLLKSGIPSLMLPLNLEQQLVAENVSRLGAGISVPDRDPLTMRTSLDQLLASGGYHRSAQQFAKSQQDKPDLTGQLIDLVNSMVG